MPTLYLMSVSALDLAECKPSALRNYNAALTHIPHTAYKLPTVQCSHWLIPPKGLCAWYSGVSESIQSYVVQDPRARRAIDAAVYQIVRAFRGGKKAVFLKTMCGSGTHRSVATAEMIGQHIKKLGYHVVIRHPHRGIMYGEMR